MSEGLQIFNASGQLVMDSNDRVITILGSHTTSELSGSISVPSIGNSGGQFIIILDWPPGDIDSTTLDPIPIYYPINFSYSYPNISWSIPYTRYGEVFYPTTFRYGYY